MPRFRDSLEGTAATEERLKVYLHANPEWVRLEFKEAKQVPVHGLRKAVAALASTSGGDLFLGVTDSGAVTGCAFDPSELSSALLQAGAPVREEVKSNLVEIVGEPTSIPLANGNRVYWLEVPQYGWMVGALNDEGTLSLYDRPGAESKEVSGLTAIDFFLKPNRARLLRRVFEQVSSLESGFNWVYQGPGRVNDDTLDPLRRLTRGNDWDRFTRTEEKRWIASDGHLALFLRLPSLYLRWERMQHREREQEMLMAKNDLGSAKRNIETYLQQEGILPRG